MTRCLPRFIRVTALATAMIWAQTVPAATEILDQVVAIVDDDVIMASELRERVTAVNRNIEARGIDAPPEDVLIRETLDRLILDSIQLQMGDRFGVRIPDQQLDAAMARIAAQSGLNLEQFRTALEQEGRSYLAMREQIRQELIIQRVQQGNVNQRIEITPQEVSSFLATEEGQKMTQPEYRIVHALLPLDSSAGDDEVKAARAHVQSLLDRIRNGENFAQVVSTSTGRYTFTGGDLGWRKLDDLPTLFSEIAPTLQPGETADVVRSPSGLHLVQLADARGGGRTVNQTEVRHILIKPSEILTEEAAKAQMEDIKARIESGEDFAGLAREFSEDIGSAAEGGSLGWTSPGQMVPAFEDVMAATEIGEISDPFRSEFGWHILEVTDRREKDVTEDMRRAQVMEYLHGRKYEEELDAWLRKIRDEAFVDIK